MSKQVRVKTKTIRRPQSGRLEILRGNSGVYFELEDYVCVTGFDYGVGSRDVEERVALLTSILCHVTGAEGSSIESLEGRAIQVRYCGMEITALGQVDATPVPEALSEYVQGGWFEIESFSSKLNRPAVAPGRQS